MGVLVEFDGDSPHRLREAGYEIDFRSARSFLAEFSLESPCIIQGLIGLDLPFSMGAFSASYGGNLRGVRIGRYCSIAGDVQTGWDDHPTDWVTSSQVGYVPDIHGWATLTGYPGRTIDVPFASLRGITTIGNDVWIGHGVFVRAGVTIGDGAVVAARSVVLSDVQPYSVVGGTPARLIRKRFAEETIAELLALRWWRFNIFQFDQRTLHSPAIFIKELSTLNSADPTPAPYEPALSSPRDLANIAQVSAFHTS